MNNCLSLDKPSGPSTICIGKSVAPYHQLHPDVKFMMPESMTHPQDHSASLLEDVVAEDLSRQIGDIAETLQREGEVCFRSRSRARARVWGGR